MPPLSGGGKSEHLPRLVRERDFGQLQLRIELEHFVRLPMSGAITFCIRTFMASFQELKAIPAWSAQLALVLDELPDDMAAYKGFLGHKADAAAWLRA